ncbi:MAG: cation diffusion facilitator family transporter [Anaerolineales bacterium]
MDRSSLTRYAWLSIAAAIATISLKAVAYLLTGSVGLLSDAVESIVNLLGALIALIMLVIAAKPPDSEHNYGHSKAEYFSSSAEGILILIASLSIAYAAIQRLLHPQGIEQASIGLAISTLASLINFFVAQILKRAGIANRSITLEADARHLMTDVYTSAGVIFAVAAVAITGWVILDPIIALIVAANILWSAYQLLRRSALGFMDTALDESDQKLVAEVLDKYKSEGIQFHALRTRQSAGRRFISVHVLVPGKWSTHKSHHIAENIEADIRKTIPGSTVFTHLEPVDDPLSYQDIDIDRKT